MKIFVSSFIIALVSFSLSAAESTSVKTALLKDIAIYPQRSAPATVVSINETTVSSRIQAQVTHIPVKVGDIVESNSTLVKMDCADYELATRETRTILESLKSQIDLAERRLDRTQKLTLKKSVSEELLDERESELNVLQANYRGAQAQLELASINQARCIVKSPFRALVIERVSAVGQYTTIGTALVKIIDIDNLEISAQIFSTDAEQLQRADLLEFEDNDTLYPVQVRAISPAINTETRNREVRLVFTDIKAAPGAAGKLVWTDTRAHIPGEYLVRRDNKLGVFSIKNGSAVFIPVNNAQPGRASPTTIPVQTSIVIDGHYSLKDNDKVKTPN